MDVSDFFALLCSVLYLARPRTAKVPLNKIERDRIQAAENPALNSRRYRGESCLERLPPLADFETDHTSVKIGVFLIVSDSDRIVVEERRIDIEKILRI